MTEPNFECEAARPVRGPSMPSPARWTSSAEYAQTRVDAQSSARSARLSVSAVISTGCRPSRMSTTTAGGGMRG